MIAPHCPGHGRRVLLGFDEYQLENTAVGVAARWRCPCGHTGLELFGVPAGTPAGISVGVAVPRR